MRGYKIEEQHLPPAAFEDDEISPPALTNVMLASYLHLFHPERLRQAVPSYDPGRHWPGSFWIRRR